MNTEAPCVRGIIFYSVSHTGGFSHLLFVKIEQPHTKYIEKAGRQYQQHDTGYERMFLVQLQTLIGESQARSAKQQRYDVCWRLCLDYLEYLCQVYLSILLMKNGQLCED